MAEHISSFMKIHSEIIDSLTFVQSNLYLEKLSLIGKQLSEDLLDIYTVNEKKMKEVVDNPRYKVTNIKEAHK